MAEHIPSAPHSGTLTISGVTLHVHRLDNGQTVIDADDVAALFAAWERGAPQPTNDEAEVLAHLLGGRGPLPTADPIPAIDPDVDPLTGETLE